MVLTVRTIENNFFGFSLREHVIHLGAGFSNGIQRALWKRGVLDEHHNILRILLDTVSAASPLSCEGG